MALSFGLIVSIPSGLHGATLFVVFAVLSIALRLSLSVFNLPYAALGAEFTEDYAEQSSVMAWRWGFGMVGALPRSCWGSWCSSPGPTA